MNASRLMEPRNTIGSWENLTPPFSSIEDYYEFGKKFVKDVYHVEYDYYRNIDYSEVTVDHFWSEYIWCVMVSGFSSKVVAKIHPNLMKAYGTYRNAARGYSWDNVSAINRNKAKYRAITLTANLLVRTPWLEFKKIYLLSPETICKLGFMGKITSQHLARNLGVDAVKPDLHLVRLSDHFGFDTPFEMCSFLSGLSDERIGVVDLILFYTCSTFGTLNIRKPGQR